jgi:hypothetical protein
MQLELQLCESRVTTKLTAKHAKDTTNRFVLASAYFRPVSANGKALKQNRSGKIRQKVFTFRAFRG